MVSEHTDMVEVVVSYTLDSGEPRQPHCDGYPPTVRVDDVRLYRSGKSILAFLDPDELDMIRQEIAAMRLEEARDG